MERVYKSMRFSGASSIALGVVIISVGVICGILAILNGAKLLKDKSNIMF